MDAKVSITVEVPIVDTVQDQVLNTTSACILELDLNTCKVEDADFCTRFRLQLRRRDFVHAIVAWFDICFSKCHRPEVFTTGPHGKYTHWKQTVFYIEDALVGEQGEVVTGMIAVRKNKKNPRDLDIKFQYNFKGKNHSKPYDKTQFYRLR